MAVSTENLDVKVNFVHPKLPTCDHLCWVHNVHAYHVVSPPELSS